MRTFFTINTENVDERFECPLLQANWIVDLAGQSRDVIVEFISDLIKPTLPINFCNLLEKPIQYIIPKLVVITKMRVAIL